VRAIALNPNLAVAHIRCAHLLSNVGRHKEAIAHAEQAIRLDPLNLIDNTLLGLFLYESRQYEAARDQLNKTLRINPSFWIGHLQLGRVYTQQGRYQEAVSELVRARELSEFNSEIFALLGRAYAVSGNTREARKVLSELEEHERHGYVSPYNIATIYAGLGETGEAVQWLEKGYEARDIRMVFLKTDPMWDDLRANPRFQDVLHRMNFPP
jgi:tetratricopeptide (TPR) repeat protein